MLVKKGILPIVLSQVTINYVSMWFCASHVRKLQYHCRHINCSYRYPLTWAHDYVATDQRFLLHFPLADLMVCNFLVSDWDMLLGYLIKSFSSALCMWDVACRTGNFLTARGLLVLDFFLPAFCWQNCIIISDSAIPPLGWCWQCHAGSTQPGPCYLNLSSWRLCCSLH